MDAVAQLHDLHTRVGEKSVAKVRLRASWVAHFLRAKDKKQAYRELQEVFQDKFDLSLKRLYSLAKKFEDSNGDILSLADGRELREAEACGLASNEEFKAYWHELCLNNKRKTAPAYRELFERLKSGVVIPGFGTWRDIFASEHGGLYPAPDRACPYRESSNTPKGWSLRNLTKLKPNAFALVAARKGTMAAAMEMAPDISRTRAGLKAARVVQIDDMWYEHKVAFGVNRHAQRVVEFSMIDVATGYFIAYLTKPVLEREDGHREVLKSKWTRYLIAHLLVTVGVPDEGVLIMGEHGTASADRELEEALARTTGGRVTFGAGGLLSTPLATGLYQGTPKGNPRFKGLLEGQHALIKNELAAVKGHMGGGREGKSEFVYGMEKQDNQLRAIARALAQVRPGIEARLDMPFMNFLDFKAIVDLMYARLNSRRDHNLEGWDEQGFVSAEYYDASAASWVAVERIREQPEPIQIALYNAIQNGNLKVRRARLSPGEAWRSRESDRSFKLPASIAALEIMGLELSVVCNCSDKLTLRYKDDSILADVKVNGILQGGGSLTRGENYRLWINPLEPCTAIVADMQGKYIGLASVSQAVRYDDKEAIERELGIRQAAIAAERRKVEPALRRMQMAENARARANVVTITGDDPALVQAQRSAAAWELNKAETIDADEIYALEEEGEEIKERVNVDDFI